MKTNIAPFTIGDKVVATKTCVTHDRKGCVKVGIVYIVKSIVFDSRVFHYNENEEGVWIVRFEDVYGGYPSTLFRKVSEQPMKKLTFAEIEKVEKEEVLTLN